MLVKSAYQNTILNTTSKYHSKKVFSLVWICCAASYKLDSISRDNSKEHYFIFVLFCFELNQTNEKENERKKEGLKLYSRQTGERAKMWIKIKRTVNTAFLTNMIPF